MMAMRARVKREMEEGHVYWWWEHAEHDTKRVGVEAMHSKIVDAVESGEGRKKMWKKVEVCQGDG